MTSLNSVGQVRAELNLTEYLKISCLELGVELIALLVFFLSDVANFPFTCRNNNFATEENCVCCFKNKTG